MADTKHLYLVDGSAYIFRAYHRLPPLTDPEGTPVGAVYGYTTMLWKLADDLDAADGPTHLAVVLDKSSHSLRNEIYDQYKANRTDPPEDLVPQFPLIRDATRAFSLPCIEEPDVEADDITALIRMGGQADVSGARDGDQRRRRVLPGGGVQLPGHHGDDDVADVQAVERGVPLSDVDGPGHDAEHGHAL